METITLIFTKRAWNPVSWLIRFMIPRSRLHLAQSSHCLILDGDDVIEANMLHGVRKVSFAEAMNGLTEVARVSYSVADAKAGLEWARTQAGKRYDWKGALGLALTPYRDWMEDDAWFCYELGAATLAVAGKDCFNDVGHINETVLLAIKP